MKLSLRPAKCAVWVSLVLPAMQAAMAAQQCLALPGAYGAVTVSGCDNDPSTGITNPMGSAILPGIFPDGFNGVALGSMPDISMSSCTYTFDHPVLASSITVDLTSMEPAWSYPVRDTFSAALDGNPYPFTNADIVQTPLLPVSTVFGSGQLEQQSGAIISAPDLSSSGKVKISASQWISSLTLTLQGSAVARVCLDDTAPVSPPPPPAPAPAPAPVAKPVAVPVGLGGVGAAAAGILGSGAFLARRRRSGKRS